MGIQGDFQKVICQSGGGDATRTIDSANQWGEIFISKCHDNNIPIKDLISTPPE